MSVELVAPWRDVWEHVAREDDSHASRCRLLRRQLPPASSPGRIPVHEETERVCRDWICNSDNDGVRASTTTTQHTTQHNSRSRNQSLTAERVREDVALDAGRAK